MRKKVTLSDLDRTVRVVGNSRYYKPREWLVLRLSCGHTKLWDKRTYSKDYPFRGELIAPKTVDCVWCTPSSKASSGLAGAVWLEGRDRTGARRRHSE